MNRLVVVVALSLVAFCSGAPTTYDQRQDGNLNLAAKLENILILVALPGSESENLNSDLSSYLSSTVARNALMKTSLKTGEIFTKPSETDKSETQDEDDSFTEFGKTSDSDEESTTIARNPSANARQLWNDDQHSTTLKRGTTLKKELSVLDEGPISHEYERSGNKYENEVGIVGSNHQLTLIGTAIEDCGPERRRNSLGICQPFADD